MKKNFIVLIVVFCKSIVGFAQNLDAVPNLHKLTADEKERCENMLKQNGITLEKTVYADYIKHDSLWYLDLTLVEAEKIGMSKSEYESVLESLEWTNKGLRELRAKGVIGVFVDEQTEPLKISNSKSDTY